MKKWMLLSLIAWSIPALAYKDGTYYCKNKDVALPSHSYRVSTIDVGGEAVPFVEVNRYFTKEATVIKGPAVHAYRGTTETLMIGAIRVEFIDGQFANCPDKEPTP